MRAIGIVAALVGMVLLAGCGYQAGPVGARTTTGQAEALRLALTPVRNDSPAPQSVALLEAQLRDLLIETPGLELVEVSSAPELRIAVTLIDYGRRRQAALPEDTGRGFAFRVILSGQLQVFAGDAQATAPLHTEAITVSRVVFAPQSLPDAEYQTMPELTESFAREVRDSLLAQDWAELQR